MLRSDPQEARSWRGRILFSWIAPLLSAARARPLKVDDLLRLDPTEDTQACADAFESTLRKAPRGAWRATRTLFRLHRGGLLRAICAGLLFALASLAAPVGLRCLVANLQSKNGSFGEGVAWSAFMFCATSIAWLAINHNFLLGQKVALRVRAGLVGSVYRKALRLPSQAQQTLGRGRLINLLTSDVEKVHGAVANISNLILSLANVGFAVALLYRILGVASLSGIAVLGALMPLSTWRMRRLGATRAAVSETADQRMAFFSEVLTSIRAMKFWAWEDHAEGRLADSRHRQVVGLKSLSVQSAILNCLFLVSPIMVALATFSTAVLLHVELHAPDVFASIAIFGLLRPSLLHIPDLLVGCVDGRVAMQRLEELLASSERAPQPPIDLAPGHVRLRGVSFSWDGTANTLEDIDLEVHPGELIAVTGPVGSGKSALLAALLGELIQRAGSCEVSGNCSYLPQQPFVVRGTVRDNILFGAPLLTARYEQAIRTACLTQDLKHMPTGDQHAVRERGANLSGGQRQRLGLARAVYHQADIILLDDPVSAVDPDVAQQIIDRCILGALADRTRIVATHHPAILARADQVLTVDGGKIVLAVRRDESDVSLLDSADPVAHSVTPAAETPAAEPCATDDEAIAKAASSLTYRWYLRSLAGGWTALLVGGLFVLRETLSVGFDYWLAYWSSAAVKPGAQFLAGFAGLAACAVAATFGRSLLTGLRGVAAANAVHDKAMHGVLHSPMSFFETTQEGHILNRFARDQRAVDESLALSFLEAAGGMAILLSTGIVVTFATPLALPIVAIVGLLYYKIQAYSRAPTRYVRHLEPIAQSPLFAHISETLTGIDTIHAFGAEPRFRAENLAALSVSQRALFTKEALQAWLSIRLELLGSALTGISGALLVFSKGHLDPALATVAITYTMVVTYTFGRVVRSLVTVESHMNSLERLLSYGRLPIESTAGTSPADWPQRGEISFEGVELRYQAHLDPALRNVSLQIEAGEKLGIVGRTGSGKSSLLAAMFRVAPLSRGRILLDGVDIAGVKLSVLRRSLAIIPQDPPLFSGSLRSALDPRNEFTDADLFAVLERVGLTDLHGQVGGLDAVLRASGTNTSVGQRQLIALARALLTHAKVLFLDEATGSVDEATESTIRNVIRKQFADSTVITIAHRFSAVAQSHRIVTMAQGCVSQIANPRQEGSQRDEGWVAAP